MFDVPTLLSYVAAALLLAIAPGPGQLLVLARTVAGGRSVGVATALGLGVGYLVHTVAAALGLSALLARSTVIFALWQYLGAPTSSCSVSRPSGRGMRHALRSRTRAALGFLPRWPSAQSLASSTRKSRSSSSRFCPNLCAPRAGMCWCSFSSSASFPRGWPSSGTPPWPGGEPRLQSALAIGLRLRLAFSRRA